MILCRLDDIPDNDAIGLPAPTEGEPGLFAARRGDDVFVYVNSCPHIGVPLDWAPGKFLSADGSRIVCATHGATFAVETGYCLSGPCLGDRLDAVMIEIKDGAVVLREDAVHRPG